MDSSKIIKLIRKMVREEVRKAVKPMMNEILAEQFIKVLSQQKNSESSLLTSVLSEATETSTGPTDEEKIVKRHKYEQRQLQERIKEISGEDPMAKMIFEDIDDSDRAAIHQSAPDGAFVDMDDEGVDLSKFGL